MTAYRARLTVSILLATLAGIRVITDEAITGPASLLTLAALCFTAAGVGIGQLFHPDTPPTPNGPT